MRKRLWSPDEDEKLQKYVMEHGYGNWSEVAKKTGLQRCGKSCRLRWINYLRPNLKRGKFTPQEKMMIVRLQKVFGNSWSKIAAHLPGRTDSDIKNFWHSHFRKKRPSFVNFIHDSTQVEDASDHNINNHDMHNSDCYSEMQDTTTTVVNINGAPLQMVNTSSMPFLVDDHDVQYSTSDHPQRSINQSHYPLLTQNEHGFLAMSGVDSKHIDLQNGFVLVPEHDEILDTHPHSHRNNSIKGLQRSHHMTWSHHYTSHELSCNATQAMLSVYSSDQANSTIGEDQTTHVNARPPEGLELVVWSCKNRRTSSSSSSSL